MFDNFAIDDEPIGCHDSCIIPEYTNPGPEPVTVVSSTLVYNGDDSAWSTGAWSKPGSNKDFENTDENHTEGGDTSAYIKFSSSDWDASVYTAPSMFNPSDYTHVRMWVMPAQSGVLFRVQFRGAEDSADVTVDNSYAFHSDSFEVGTWQEVIIPIDNFDSADGQSDLLVRSATDSETAGFWIDDIELLVAK